MRDPVVGMWQACAIMPRQHASDNGNAPATTSHHTQSSLGNLLLFGRLDKTAQAKIAENTWERAVAAGEILIQEGEVGSVASELYVVKSGKFEVRPGAEEPN